MKCIDIYYSSNRKPMQPLCRDMGSINKHSCSRGCADWQMFMATLFVVHPECPSTEEWTDRFGPGQLGSTSRRAAHGGLASMSSGGRRAYSSCVYKAMRGCRRGERSFEGYSVFLTVTVTHLNVTLSEATNSKNEVTNIKTWNDALQRNMWDQV